MNQTMECEDVMACSGAYLDRSLEANDRNSIDSHLRECPACREGLERFAAVHGLMQGTLGAQPMSDKFRRSTSDLAIQEAEAPESAEAMEAELAQDESMAEVGAEEEAALSVPLSARLGGAPWWFVSVALHALVLAFAALVYQTLSDDRLADIITVTKLEKPVDPLQPEEDKPKERDVLEAKQEVKPNDPTAEQSNIVVPPDLQAQVSDHFETNNPELENQNSAFGNPESTSFHSAEGNDGDAGGGGNEGALSDDVIGVAGAGSKGTGGGAGGGNGTGFGTGNGSGGGSFGQRSGAGRATLVKRNGGSKVTESAVDKGLEWLARNQEADGHWDGQKHGGKGGGVEIDAAMTGYALLAFLGAGHTEKVGKYRDVVRKGVAWLIKEQGQHGRWGANNYAHGIASMAIAESAAMSKIAETKKAAQKAIEGVEYGQIKGANESDRQAWDYGPGGKTNDSSVMAWNVMALKSGKVGGLVVDHAAFEGTITWLNAGQDLKGLKPTDPLPGSDWEGGMMSYRGTLEAPNKGAGSHAVMAAAGLCRIFIEGQNLDAPGVAGPCNIILNKKNHLIPEKYPYNMYFGYYAALLMFQKGGDHWKAWNEGMKKALIDGQAKGGNDDGSWDPTGAVPYTSRVMSTALCVLSLEVYYRYLRLEQKK